MFHIALEWVFKTADLVRQYLPHRPKLTIEIREVCADQILASLKPDWSDYAIDLYVFLHLWVVNKKEVPTAVKEWNLAVEAGGQTLKAERVGDISNWHQHSKVKEEQHGITVMRDIRENLHDFGAGPLQHGIPTEGWVCFMVRETKESLLQDATLSLTLIDSFGHKHSLKSQGPWPCKGGMVNPQTPY